MILRRSSFSLAALMMGAAMAPAQAQMRPPSIGVGTANPSAIVAAELGLSRLAREKGQWTALRTLAEKDAVLFAPGAVNAPRWLKGQADPAQPMSWNPQQIFISCDGSYGMAVGLQRNPDGGQQRYVSLWRQQRKGDYKWVMRVTSEDIAPAGAAGSDPVPISANVATCGRRASALDEAAYRRERERRRPDVVRIGDPPPAVGSAQSADGTLRWTWSAQGDGQAIELFMRRPGGEERVLHFGKLASAS